MDEHRLPSTTAFALFLLMTTEQSAMDLSAHTQSLLCFE
jgi:hypothetical protein